MTYQELNYIFALTLTTPTDFIAWAALYGVKVHPATVSRHRAGTQSITGPWVLAYRWYFQNHPNVEDFFEELNQERTREDQENPFLLSGDELDNAVRKRIAGER